jgi:hypothetical protein
VPVRDVDCAFKLFDRRMLQGLTIEAGGAMFSSELLARLAAKGARIVEVPVRHLPREKGNASGGNPRVIARAFYELLTIPEARSRRRRAARRP